MTGLELIRRAMRLIGALGVGEAPTAEETSDCLTALNQLLSSWSLDALTIYTKTNESYTNVPGLPYFTWGVGGDFDSERPDKIFRMYVTHPDGATYELSKIEKDFYDPICDKMGTGTPDRFYYSPDYPLGKVYLYPNPDMAYTIESSVFKKITKLDNASDEVIIPPGWDRALAYNLALEIAPEFGLQLSEVVIKSATDSLAAVKRMNIKPILSQTEIPNMSEITKANFNIRTGE